MHIEFKKFLNQLVIDWLKQAKLEPLAVNNFQVLTPPPDARAFVGSNLAFSLSRKLGIEPVALCAELAEFGNNIDSSPFILMPTTSGFLNAKLKNTWIKNFINKFNSEILQGQFLNFNQQHLENKIQNAHNPDLKKLLLTRPSFNREDRYMALALLGNAELSVDPYLSKLKGKENIPWLLERFSKDWRSIREQVHPCGLASLAPGLLEGLESNDLLIGGSNNFSDLTAVLKHLLLAILSIRSFDSLDRLFPFCLSLVNSFYAYYNQPYFRSGLQLPDGSLWPALAQAVELLGILVEQTCNASFFSCGN